MWVMMSAALRASKRRKLLALPLVQLGVTADRMQAELDARELESLAAFAFVRLLTALPVTPGGLGVVA